MQRNKQRSQEEEDKEEDPIYDADTEMAESDVCR